MGFTRFRGGFDRMVRTRSGANRLPVHTPQSTSMLDNIQHRGLEVLVAGRVKHQLLAMGRVIARMVVTPGKLETGQGRMVGGSVMVGVVTVNCSQWQYICLRLAIAVLDVHQAQVGERAFVGDR